MSCETLGAENEKHEIRVLNCDGKLKADENWMTAETSRVYDVPRGQIGIFIADDQCGQDGKFKP